MPLFQRIPGKRRLRNVALWGSLWWGVGLLDRCGLCWPAFGVSSGAGLATAETLVVPYSCSKIGNRVIAAPSSPRRYPIQSARDALTLSFCPAQAAAAGASTSDCPRIAVHHFDILCGNKRVQWADLALAIADGRWGEGRGSGRAIGPISRCALTSERAGRGDPAGPGLSLVCGRGTGSFTTTRLLVPDGYAPLAEVSARIEGGPARIAVGQRSPVMPTLVTSSPLPDITPLRAVLAGEDPRLDFAHAMATSVPAAAVVLPEQGWGGLWILISGGLVAIGAALLAAWRLPARVKQAKATAARAVLKGIVKTETLVALVQQSISKTQLPFAPATKLKPIGDIQAANAASAVGSLLADAEARLGSLKNAGPLNDVLRAELGQLRQRLTTLQAAAAESPDAAGKASPGFRNLLRDIERVRRIADSAALSIAPGAHGDARSNH